MNGEEDLTDARQAGRRRYGKAAAAARVGAP